jgi:probable rRNA maturation factor
MILLDPDLGTDLDPSAAADTQHAAVRAKLPAAASASNARNFRPPSVRALSRFLREAQAALRLRGEVTVLLTSDQAIRRLNRQFRGKNKATDVLSFPADSSAPGAEKIAGDLAVSIPTARRQATLCGHSLGTELKVLILHGLLHLAGYDHEADSGQMARRERLLRGRLGLPKGLIERVSSPTLATEKSRKDRAREMVRTHPDRKSRNAARVGRPASACGLRPRSTKP